MTLKSIINIDIKRAIVIAFIVAIIKNVALVVAMLDVEFSSIATQITPYT